MQNEMKLTDESWISYQQGKGNEEYQKYIENLTDMQNHVLPYLQPGRKRKWQEKRRNHRFMNAWKSIRESSRKNREKISRREGLI